MESKKIIRLCMGSVCHQLGVYEVLPKIQGLLVEYQLEDKVQLKGAFCLGPCRKGMVMRLEDKFVTNITVDNIDQKFKLEILPYLKREEEGEG
jgi:NADH:ubiquinone oxidoreductase subunit E